MKKTLLFLLLLTAFASKAQLKKLFQRESLYGHFSGVVLVETKDSTVLEFCYGARNSDKAIDMNSAFDIGSNTKQFTAAAILHLVQSGNFKLHDNINPLLGKYANEKWERVTVHQLLTHTSGIPSLFQTEQGLEIFFPEERAISKQDLISKFSYGKLLFKPGEEFSYSNSGYILLAVIIENVTGRTFEEYMTGMFKKYGLDNTSFEPGKNAAQPYYGYRNDLEREAPTYHSSWFAGGGGVYSTVSDLSKWIDVITSDNFLNEELREKFLKPFTNQGYGYGWVHSGSRVSHDGGNAGFISQLSFDRETNEKVIILTNRSFEQIHMFGKSTAYLSELSDKCWKHINGEEIEVLPEIKKLTVKEVSPFRNGVIVDVMDSTLMITMNGNIPSRVIYNSPLAGKNEQEKKMIEIAQYLKKKKYWSLAKHCDGEMKFVCYSGMMSIGMKMMKKQTGGIDEIIPYYVEEGHGLIRMKGPDGILDLITYFDEEGYIQGIFENGSYEVDKEVLMVAYPIGNNRYYLDGLPYGEKSATIKITQIEITFYQLNRAVSYARQAN